MLKVNASMMTSMMFRRMVISLASASALTMTACNKAGDKTVPVQGVKGAVGAQASQVQTCSVTTTDANNTSTTTYYQITPAAATATGSSAAAPSTDTSSTPAATTAAAAAKATVKAVSKEVATAAVTTPVSARAKNASANSSANTTTATVAACSDAQVAAIKAANTDSSTTQSQSGGTDTTKKVAGAGSSDDSADGSGTPAPAAGANQASDKGAAPAAGAAKAAGNSTAAPAATGTPAAATGGTPAPAAKVAGADKNTQPTADGRLAVGSPEFDPTNKVIAGYDYQNVVMSDDGLVLSLKDLVKNETDVSDSKARGVDLGKRIFSITSKISARADQVADASGKTGTQQAVEVTITMRDKKDSNKAGEQLVFTGALENKDRTIVLTNPNLQGSSITFVCADKSQDFCKVSVLRYDEDKGSLPTHIYAVLRKTDNNAVDWYSTSDVVAAGDTATADFHSRIDEFIKGQTTNRAVQFFILETTEIVDGSTNAQATFATKDAEVFGVEASFVAQENRVTKDASQKQSAILSGSLAPLPAKTDWPILMDWELRNSLTDSVLKYDMQKAIKGGILVGLPRYNNMVLALDLNGADRKGSTAIRLRITREQVETESFKTILSLLNPDPAPAQ